MPKNIVICCDGTGNEINTTISNVLKLFRVLPKDEGQRVYYHPGVGTSAWKAPGDVSSRRPGPSAALRPAQGSMRIRSPPTVSCA